VCVLYIAGGMGNNYSLPRTPEDFLSNVDEMDTQEGGEYMYCCIFSSIRLLHVLVKLCLVFQMKRL